MKYTNYLSLVKPDTIDYYAIMDFNNNSEILDESIKNLNAMGIEVASSGSGRYLLSSQDESGFYEVGKFIGDEETVVHVVPTQDIPQEIAKFKGIAFPESKVIEASTATGTYFVWSDQESPFDITVKYSILSSDGLSERVIGTTTLSIDNLNDNVSNTISLQFDVEHTIAPGERLIHRLVATTAMMNQTISLAFGGHERPSRFMLPFPNGHNDLEGLEGGAPGEYYHLSMNDYQNNLLRNGDGSSLRNIFTQASARENLISNEELRFSLGKIQKYFADLQQVAFSGSKVDVGLGNADNTSDLNKPISTATQAALDRKLGTSGGVMTGTLDMGNASIINAGSITIADPGAAEGIGIKNGNGWGIFESPDDLTNATGDIQFATNAVAELTGAWTRRATIRKDGTIQATNGFDANNKVIRNVADGVNVQDAVNKRQLDKAIPVGMSMEWSGITIPVGYLEENGQTVSRTTYAELFAAIGTTYGAGDGVSTFHLPNSKGRTSVGYDSAQSEFNATGKLGGSKAHTLLASEMPSHTHSLPSHTHTLPAHTHSLPSHTHSLPSHTHSLPSHTHSFSGSTNSTGAHTHSLGTDYDGGGGSNYATVHKGSSGASHMTGYTNSTGNHTHSISGTTGSATPSISSISLSIGSTSLGIGSTSQSIGEATLSNGSTGSSGAHQNLQPYIVKRRIIKY